jgi:hypothetical protein
MKTQKLSLILLLFLFTIISAFSQKSESKLIIKSVIVLEEKSDVLVKKKLTDSETYYDQNGNIIEEIKYKQGKVSKHFKYVYDKDGHKIKEEEFDSSGDLIEYSEYKYENGLRVEKVVYGDKGKMKSKKIYQYTTY